MGQAIPLLSDMVVKYNIREPVQVVGSSRELTPLLSESHTMLIYVNPKYAVFVQTTSVLLGQTHIHLI